MLFTPSVGYENYDLHTKFYVNISALSKTETRNAIYRERGFRRTAIPLTTGKLALRGRFLFHIKQ